jgi:acetate---CoA ligase (ADP-forming)
VLESLFSPRSIAVLGPSSRKLHLGNRVIRNLQDYGFKGPIYPIDPSVSRVRGLQAYASLLDIPTDVDVAYLVLPAKSVPGAIEECGYKGVKFVILSRGGFAETGPEGEALQEECLSIARQHGIRIFGPNGQGIINSDPQVQAPNGAWGRVYLNFANARPEAGHISIIAVSGGMGEVILQAFVDLGVGIRLYASNGNACDVTIPDILEHYGEDGGTRVIVLYLEGVREPKRFMEVARRVSAVKPVLVMKAGRTEQGAKAAASHTGGLAGADLTSDLIFEKSGILSFRDEGELCQAAAALASQPIPHGNGVGLITNSGGPAIISTDIIAGAGLEIPPLSDRARAILKEKLRAEASIDNPVDVLPGADAAQWRAALDVLMDDAPCTTNGAPIDSVLINFVTPFFVDTESVAREIAEVSRQRLKPVVCNLMTDRHKWAGVVRILKEAGVPCYGFPGTAAKALVALTRYHEIRSRETGEVRTFDDVHREGVRDILQKAKEAGREMLSAAEAYGILAAYGFPVAGWRIAQNVNQAAGAAAELGFPVVLKADSESVVHKSDVAGVVVNLRDGDSVRLAAKKMQARLGQAPDGAWGQDLRFFVQEYLPGGMEVIVGAKAEQGLGHLIMFGLGGIHVEVFKDVVFQLTPVTTGEAWDMLASIKAASLLTGVRGQAGVDRAGIVDILLRLSQLVAEHPAIEELDLNPIIAYPDRVCVVDARIRIRT